MTSAPECSVRSPQPTAASIPPLATEPAADSELYISPARRVPLTILACAIALFSVAGIALALWLRTVFAGYPDPRSWFNAFFVLFARNEVAGLSIVAVFYAAVAIWYGVRGNQGPPLVRPLSSFGELETAASLERHKLIPLLVALSVFVFATIGTQFVMHDYLLTGDENAADFQSQIFARGMIWAKVPDAYTRAIGAIKPIYIAYFPSIHGWMSAYLPVYAAMRALFRLLYLQSVLNPFLAAVTIIALYGVARNTWSESKMNALVAVGLLASSSQFLLMSMTGYAMPAHLALNTIWLWLYSRPDRRSFYLAPLVGVLAIGLHQPIVHALFVLPFLFRLAWERQWRPVFVFAVVYLTGCASWFAWKTHFQALSTPGLGVGSLLRLANPRMAIIQPMNVWLIIGWSSLATPFLVLLGFKSVFTPKPRAANKVEVRAPSILRDAALSCILTFGFYYFFYLDQAHGWGYRYFYGTLGCFVLVAVAGFDRLSILIGQRRALVFTSSGILLSMLLQLPLRSVQAESFVRPYAQASEAFRNIPADVVAFDPRAAWYTADLIRNDPFLEERPVILSLLGLTKREILALEKNGRAAVITRDQLAGFGLSTLPRSHYARDPLHLGWGE